MLGSKDSAAPMRIYSIEFDEYEKAALLTAIENDKERLKKLHDRVYLAGSQKAVPHPDEKAIKSERPPATEPAAKPESTDVYGDRINQTVKRYFTPKECCGSNGARHKKDCSEKAKPTEEVKPPEEVMSHAVAAAIEEPVSGDQQFACKECGNLRTEPYGTNAILLDCPNSWSDDSPEKHVYELKSEEV